MQNPNSFPSASGLKRKCDDNDGVGDLFLGVSLSPHNKKLRQDFGSTSFSKDSLDMPHLHTGFGVSSPELSEQLSRNLPMCVPDVDLPEHMPETLPICPANDERAIVLYKPVNPPLFPGGPSVGSQIMLNASILSTGMLDASSLLTGRRNDHLPWLRAATNSSRVSADDMEAAEERVVQSGSNPDNRLAVVPWVSNSPKLMMNLLPMADSQAAEQIDSQVVDNMYGEGEGLDIEAMEEDSESGMEDVNSQLNNYSINYHYEPWQHYGVAKPQYSSIMWSH